MVSAHLGKFPIKINNAPFEDMSDTWNKGWVNRKWWVPTKENLLVTSDDGTSDGQTSSPASQDYTVLVTECPVANLLGERHAIPHLGLSHLLLIQQTHTCAFPL
jgi:hypothetical protein